MNLALHGLSGDIRLGNSYYDDLHDAVGALRLRHGQPAVQRQRRRQGRSSPATSALPVRAARGPTTATTSGSSSSTRRSTTTAGPGSSWPTPPATPRHSEAEIRRQLIEERRRRRDGRDRPQLLLHRHPARDAVVPRQGQARHRPRGHGAVHRRPPHLPPDRPGPPRLPARADRVPRQHRAPLPRRGARDGRRQRGAAWPSASPTARTSTCPASARSPRSREIEAQGWSLNPGRYTGVAAGDEDDEDFAERLAELYEEFTTLSDEAEELRRKVDAAVQGILDA